jgi:hypothetical protein
MRHNWPAIKQAYVEGGDLDGALKFPTLEELSLTHHVTTSSLMKRCADERWIVSQQNYCRKIEAERQKCIAESLGAIAAEIDLKTIQSLDGISVNVQNRVNAATDKPLTIREMKDLVMVLGKIQEVRQLVLGRTEWAHAIAQTLPKAEWTVTNGRAIIAGNT